MRTLARMAIYSPWLTIFVILGITVFFGYHIKDVRIDNEVKTFLPDFHPVKQNYMRTDELFGSQVVAVVGISVEKEGPYQTVFNPYTLQVVQQMHDWMSQIELESNFDHWIWATPEEVPAIDEKKAAVKGICTPEMLEEIEKREIPEDIFKAVKVVACTTHEKKPADDVISLASMKVIYDKEVPSETAENEMEHQLMIEDLWETAPQTQEEADTVRGWVDTWDMYKNNVVSPDYKSTALYLFIPNGVSIEYAEQLQQMLEQKVREMDKPDDGIFFEIGGLPMISVWLGKYLNSDLRRLIPFVLLVIVLVLFLSFRNATGVIMPFITVSFATIWTIGLTALVHKPLSLTTSSLPTMIIAVGSAYTIHIIHHFFEQMRAGVSKRDGIIETMAKVGMAVVMAGLTTVGGFYSLTTSSVTPVKDLGYFASFGTFAALFISITMIPAMLIIFGRDKKNTNENNLSAMEHVEQNPGPLGYLLRKMADLLIQYKKPFLVFALVLVAIGFALASRVRVTSNMVEYFLPESPIRQTDVYLSEQFGGTNTFSLVFDGGEPDYWKDPAALHKMEELIQYTQKEFPEIGKVMSMIDYIKKMNMALRANDPTEYKIPDSRQAVADCLFLYAQKSDSMESVIDFEYRFASVNYKVTTGQTMFMMEMKNKIDQWIAANWPEIYGKPAPPPSIGERLMQISGMVPHSVKMMEQHYYFSGINYIRLIVDRLIVIGQISSIALSIIVVFILASIIFRSIVGGLLSIVPTILAVLGNFATMGLLDLALDIGTALVSAAAVGIGIDYAIHYINRYRVERIAGANSMQAVIRTHLTSGKAIVFNALAVALGFFVLLFSNFIPMQRMGLLTGFTMISASLIALTILPILLLIFRPKFIRKVAHNSDNENGGNQ